LTLHSLRERALLIAPIRLALGVLWLVLARIAGAAAMFPSTIGVSVLAAIALFPSPTLAALLGGVRAGLGIAALLTLPSIDPALLVDPRRQVVYRR